MTFPTFVFLQEDENTARQVGSRVPVTWSGETAPGWALAETVSCVLGLKHSRICLAHSNSTGCKSCGECSPEPLFCFRGLSSASFCGLSLQEIYQITSVQILVFKWK